MGPLEQGRQEDVGLPHRVRGPRHGHPERRHDRHADRRHHRQGRARRSRGSSPRCTPTSTTRCRRASCWRPSTRRRSRPRSTRPRPSSSAPGWRPWMPRSSWKRQQALFEAKLVSEDELDSAQAALRPGGGPGQPAAGDARQGRDQPAVLGHHGRPSTASWSRATTTSARPSRRHSRRRPSSRSPRTSRGCSSPARSTRPTSARSRTARRCASPSTPTRSASSIGKVAQIRLSPKITNNVVTYPVIVEVDNKDLKLLPGMTAEVRVQVAQGRERAARARLGAALPARAAGHERRRRSGLQGGRAGRHASLRTAPGRRAVRGTAPRGSRLPAAGQSGRDRSSRSTFMPGLTDGQYVEVRKGDLAEGDEDRRRPRDRAGPGRRRSRRHDASAAGAREAGMFNVCRSTRSRWWRCGATR